MCVGKWTWLDSCWHSMIDQSVQMLYQTSFHRCRYMVETQTRGRLPKLQKRAVRIITLNKYNAHTEPILKSLGLLKVNDIFTLQCLKFYFKCTHERVPTTFASFFTRNTARHDHNTRQRHQPEILFSHTSRARKCIKFYIPLLLRSMPTCIIDKIYTHSLNGFSNYTKQYMLAGYENSCQTRNCYVCAHA